LSDFAQLSHKGCVKAPVYQNLYRCTFVPEKMLQVWTCYHLRLTSSSLPPVRFPLHSFLNSQLSLLFHFLPLLLSLFAPFLPFRSFHFFSPSSLRFHSSSSFFFAPFFLFAPSCTPSLSLVLPKSSHQGFGVERRRRAAGRAGRARGRGEEEERGRKGASE